MALCPENGQSHLLLGAQRLRVMGQEALPVPWQCAGRRPQQCLQSTLDVKCPSHIARGRARVTADPALDHLRPLHPCYHQHKGDQDRHRLTRTTTYPIPLFKLEKVLRIFYGIFRTLLIFHFLSRNELRKSLIYRQQLMCFSYILHFEPRHHADSTTAI